MRRFMVATVFLMVLRHLLDVGNTINQAPVNNTNQQADKSNKR